MYRYVMYYVLQKLVGVGVFVILMGVLGVVVGVQVGFEVVLVLFVMLVSVLFVFVFVVFVLIVFFVKMKEQFECLVGSFWQGVVGKGVDSFGWNVWLNVYDFLFKVQDKDKDLVVDILIGEVYDDCFQGCVFWIIEGCNVFEYCFVWCECVEVFDVVGQFVVCEGGMFFGVFLVDGVIVIGIWSDGGCSQFFMLKCVVCYQEVMGIFGQVKLIECYLVMGDVVIDVLI